MPLPTFLLPFLPRGGSEEDRGRPACTQAGCQGLLRRGPLNSGGGVCTALTQRGRGRAPPRGERGSPSPSLPASRLYAEVRTEAAYPDGEGGAGPGLSIRCPCSPGSHVCRAGDGGSAGRRGYHGWSGHSAPPRHHRAAPSLHHPCPVPARRRPRLEGLRCSSRGGQQRAMGSRLGPPSAPPLTRGSRSPLGRPGGSGAAGRGAAGLACCASAAWQRECWRGWCCASVLVTFQPLSRVSVAAKGGHSRAAGCLSSQNRRGRKWPLEVV